MEGGPPSADITYPLPEAQSAVCFALPLDREVTRAYLRKDLPDGCRNHEKNNIDTNIKSYKLAIQTSTLLQKKGYKAVPVFPNFKYREEMPGWELKMYPELSLRYIAMRSGVGSVGWSGNIGVKGYGAGIILGGLVTSASLEPTDPISPEDSFCNKCKLCVKVCAFRMFDNELEESITLGGYVFKFAKRRNLARCQIVCGGLSGMDKTGRWSTWSPGRYLYPDTDKDVMRTLSLAVTNFLKWPKNNLHVDYDVSELEHDEDIITALGSNKEKILQMIKDVKLTCGNCQLICTGNAEDTKKNYDLLVNSGCIIQNKKGDIELLQQDKAQEIFNAMDKKHKKLYYRELKR